MFIVSNLFTIKCRKKTNAATINLTSSILKSTASELMNEAPEKEYN